MWWLTVKSGGDSGAPQQVSDIDGGFGRPSSTAASRGGHGKLSRAEKYAWRPPVERADGCWAAIGTSAATCQIAPWRCSGAGHACAFMRAFAIRNDSLGSSLVGWFELFAKPDDSLSTPMSVGAAHRPRGRALD